MAEHGIDLRLQMVRLAPTTKLVASRVERELSELVDHRSDVIARTRPILALERAATSMARSRNLHAGFKHLAAYAAMIPPRRREGVHGCPRGANHRTGEHHGKDAFRSRIAVRYRRDADFARASRARPGCHRPVGVRERAIRHAIVGIHLYRLRLAPRVRDGR